MYKISIPTYLKQEKNIKKERERWKKELYNICYMYIN
jgi:hypothetical protein